MPVIAVTILGVLILGICSLETTKSIPKTAARRVALLEIKER